MPTTISSFRRSHAGTPAGTVTQAQQLAKFVEQASYAQISESARQQVKIRILDALGCAIGALGNRPATIIRDQITEFNGHGKCTLIGGGAADPDWAALYNGALVRYLDFNDSYLAKGETCHPSDNLAALLAAGEYADRSGRDLMSALALAYQVQCRLSDVAPVRASGFDHTVQGAYGAAAGVAKILGLDGRQAANAIAICGTAFNALRVTRTGKLSQWKGLAAPNTASCCTRMVFLARRGLTGPLEVFEGEKGFMDAISGFFEIDWAKETLESVNETILKKYNAEIHSQTAIEAVLGLKRQHGFAPADVERVDIEIFDVAYKIIGGGEEGDKTVVTTKEQADHSLPYIVAVAILDGEVMPEQYLPERLLRNDVQQLLRRVSVRSNAAFSERFPQEMPCRVKVELRGGNVLTAEMRDYPGFVTRPMSWDSAFQKFERLARSAAAPSLVREIAGAVAELEGADLRSLTALLARVNVPEAARRGEPAAAREEKS